MELLRVTYRLAVTPADAEARAEEIAREQTVEVPRAALRDPALCERIVGRVEAVSPDAEAPGGGPDGARVTIAYPVDTTACDPAQLLNVVFGMTSLQPDAVCAAIDPPASLCRALGGPRFGIEGLRKAAGVHERALTCTAVKPLGLSPQALAARLRIFARAGLDVVKDDQGLADHAFCPFEARVRACLAAADEVAQQTGRLTLYAPNLIGAPEALRRQQGIAEELGARALMASPMLIGLPAFAELCRRASVPVLAHPSFGGTLRFAPEALFGTLFRLYGADAAIFVGYAGRYGTPRASCRALAKELRDPLHGLRPALPVPGGGISLEEIPEILSFYGRDSMLLVGGSLLVAQDDAELFERSRRFADRVAAEPLSSR
jgi:ribulose-bisphosphate carboxylase large chain